MIDSGSRSQVRPLESFKRSRFGLLAIASFIIHYLGWQVRDRNLWVIAANHERQERSRARSGADYSH